MTQKTPAFIISPDWIVPVIPTGTILENHSLVVQGERITDLLRTEDIEQKYAGWQRYHLPQQIVIPGLINAHGHAAMTLLRGFADDIELMDWLHNHIWPVESRFVNEDFVYDGTSLAIVEMISTGTTCAADTYFFPNAVAAAFSDLEFRGQIGLPVIQFSNAWATGETEHIEKAVAFHNRTKDNPLITTAFAPHAPYTVTDEGFEQIRSYSEQLQMPIHLHLHETEDEVRTALQETGKRPIQRIADLGLMSASLQAIHMTQLTEEEIKLVAAKGVHVAHCPDSNLKLASGFCPVSRLVESGVNVCVGTDGAASNNNLDMLAEIRSAALLGKGVSGKATSISAEYALAMGTINGARMLGLDDRIGSIEIGKLADIVAVDLSSPNFQPIYNPLSQLIYSASGHQVTNVWINGKHILEQGELIRFDVEGLMAKVSQWQEKISA